MRETLTNCRNLFYSVKTNDISHFHRVTDKKMQIFDNIRNLILSVLKKGIEKTKVTI